MREQGTVIEVRDRIAAIRIIPADADRCGTCRACSMGQGVERTIEVSAPAGVEAGDRVVLDVALPSRYLGILLFFVLPLVFLGAGCAAGYFAGRALFPGEFLGDLLTIIPGLAGMILYYFAARFFAGRLLSRRPPPRIIHTDRPK